MGDILLLFLIVYLSYQNAQLAKQKGKNTIGWVIVTVVAMFMAGIVGAMLMMIGYRGEVTQGAVNAFMLQHPVKVITIQFMTLGGYLLIRYFLEKMPDIKKKKD